MYKIKVEYNYSKVYDGDRDPAQESREIVVVSEKNRHEKFSWVPDRDLLPFDLYTHGKFFKLYAFVGQNNIMDFIYRLHGVRVWDWAVPQPWLEEEIEAGRLESANEVVWGYERYGGEHLIFGEPVLQQDALNTFTNYLVTKIVDGEVEIVDPEDV